ncbi:prolyl oligopeptidase family serine peptidase [Bacillus mangrovi]|uniref:Prolyl oligopeptidase family serine peptidase n=1 Tax=Metabacillus mangrovi TaxID=1491830 RepID=A0A7X2S634_9BACI|nr:acetylxylan esterase [Metabacillus mangrovi]MTH53921.1 prolyl oligopeptidase family serine peptidase [Metabacillus mangrovi]
MSLFDMPFEELEEYKPSQTKNDDFDLFWNGRVKESRSQPLNIKISPRPYWVEGINLYEVYFDGFRNSKIYGLYVHPLKREAGMPAAVIFPGYNWNTIQAHYAFKYAVQGIPVLLVQVRGQSIQSPDLNFYSNGGPSGWMTQGISDADQYYYSYVYMDAFRSIDAIKEISGSTKVFLEGGSQGGALAIAVAALQQDILFTCADIPFLSHIRKSVELAAEGPYQEIQHYFRVHDPLHKTEKIVYETLSYIDCMNLAGGIGSPVMIGIGLEDNVCPPSSGFALYNHLSGEKQIKVYPEFGHGLSPIHEEEKLKFAASFIKGGS